MERGYTIGEMWAAARRRLRPALAAAAAVVVVGAVVVAGLPDEYRAEATIVLEPYRAHADLVTPAVTTLFEERLRVARQQLLARPVLEKAVNDHGLYPEIRERGGLDAAVSELRKHLEVFPDGESAVSVAFRTKDKEKAAPVVQTIAEGFARANADLRTTQATRVFDVIQEELTAVQGRLEGQEAMVRDFRRAHDGELPEQVEANMREAERATRLLESAKAYARDLERRRALAPTHPTSPEVERFATIESDVLRALNRSRTIYSEEHPESVRLERELEGVRTLKREAEARVAGYRLERESAIREISRADREIADLEKRINVARDRATAGAKWGAELTVLERDRDLLREKHRSLLSRRVESEVALALEKRSAPQATRLVSPPVEPASPVAPDRLRLIAVVVALALGLAIAVGLFLESRDATVRTPQNAREALGLPLLAVVPTLDDKKV